MRFGIFLGNAGRNSGGPEVYETELVRSLARQDQSNEYEVFCVDQRGPALLGIRQENFRFHTLWPSIRPISMTFSLPAASLFHGTKSMHATFMPPLLSLQPYILTLVCFSMFRHPELYPRAIRLRVQTLILAGVRSARYFLCVSENVRDLFAERFHIPLDRMAVTHMAASKMFRPIPEDEKHAELSRRFGITAPYFLFSGRWEHRKNIVGTLRGFAHFKRTTRLPHKLVLTGQRTWAAAEAERVIQELKIEKDITDLGKSPVEDLPLLYGGATALVYPSLWEGFGMPIVEAMACGTPSITSKVSSMPEVAGDAGILVDPYSVEEIGEAMRRIAESEALRSELASAALRRSQLFSWDETARLTRATYEMLASRN